MTAIPVQITSPHNGDVLVGTAAVSLSGAAQVPASLAGVPIYYRWYSSLFPAQQDRYSLHANALATLALPYSAALGPGSQGITLAASDRAGEGQADQNAIQHGGVTGGTGGPTACLIHVLAAILVRPAANATLSKASAELAARAPLKWDKPEYASLNRLRYRFLLAPSSGATAELAPNNFKVDDVVPTLRYVGALPASLPVGSATLTLRVEDTQDASKGHQVSIPVTLAA